MQIYHIIFFTRVFQALSTEKTPFFYSFQRYLQRNLLTLHLLTGCR